MPNMVRWGPETAGLLLLGAPVLLFNATWCATPFAIATSLAVVVAIICGSVGCNARPEGTENPYQWTLAVLLLACIAIILGVGGIFPPKWDWEKHLMVADHLTIGPWPLLEAGIESSAQPVVYYFPFYLIPALLGKVLWPWGQALAFCFLTAVGVFLLLRGTQNLLGFSTLATVFLWFLLFSPLDYFGILLKGLLWFPHQEPQWNVSSHIPPFHGLLDSIAWLPQTLVPMLALPLVLSAFQKPSGLAAAVSASALAFAWAPLSSAALVFPLAAALLKHPHAARQPAVILAVCCGALAALPQFLLLILLSPVGAVDSRIPELLFPEGYIFAVAVTLGPWIFIATRRTGLLPKPPLYASLIALLPPMFLRIGELTDFQMKFVVPVIFVLAIYSLDVAARKYWLAFVFLAVGSISAVVQLGNGLSGIVENPRPFASRPFFLFWELPEDFVNRQYAGRQPSAIARTLFKFSEGWNVPGPPSATARDAHALLNFEPKLSGELSFIVRARARNHLQIEQGGRLLLERKIDMRPTKIRVRFAERDGRVRLIFAHPARVTHVMFLHDPM